MRQYLSQCLSLSKRGDGHAVTYPMAAPELTAQAASLQSLSQSQSLRTTMGAVQLSQLQRQRWRLWLRQGQLTRLRVGEHPHH